MKKLNTFITSNYPKIVICLIVLIFFNTCGNPTKSLNRKIDTLSQKLDSLESITLTRRELKIEGLRSEKRMIQSTDRTLLDVTRQSVIDKEIDSLEK